MSQFVRRPAAFCGLKRSDLRQNKYNKPRSALEWEQPFQNVHSAHMLPYYISDCISDAIIPQMNTLNTVTGPQIRVGN